PAVCQAQFLTLSDEGTLGTAQPPPPEPPVWYGDEANSAAYGRLGYSNRPRAAPAPKVAVWSPVPAPTEGRAGLGPGQADPGTWYTPPEGQLDFLARNGAGDQKPPADLLWLAGFFRGDGTDSPCIRQVRLDYDEDGWIDDLPAYYQRDPDGRA